MNDTIDDSTIDDGEDGRELAAGSTLRVLSRRAPVTSGWRTPDLVRRTAVRRRRVRWSAGAAVVVVTALAAALSIGNGAPRGQVAERHGVHTVAGPHGAIQLVADTAPLTSVDPAQLEAVVAAEQRLSLALLQQAGDGSNVTVSPMSLYLALGMLRNGARGETADQIATALQAAGLSTGDENAGLAALTAELASAAKAAGIELDSANSLWQQQGFVVKQPFLAALATYYRTGVWQVDFADGSAANDALNAWTSENTHGKITKLFDRLDPQTVLVLANAIFFHADWATPFVADETVPGPFTTGEGSTVTAQFMNGEYGATGAATDDYACVRIPYQGQRFEAMALMPRAGSLNDFVAGLTPASVESIAASAHSNVEVALPRFSTTSRVDLKPVLTALGMRTAFSDLADLSGLSEQPTKVDQVIQRAYLSVGEKGTTAAAATGISVLPTSVSTGTLHLRFDHPFLFLVRDTETGAILFASEITDPSAG